MCSTCAPLVQLFCSQRHNANPHPVCGKCNNFCKNFNKNHKPLHALQRLFFVAVFRNGCIVGLFNVCATTAECNNFYSRVFCCTEQPQLFLFVSMSFAQILGITLHLHISIFCILYCRTLPTFFLFASATLTQNLGTTLHLHVIKFATFLL